MKISARVENRENEHRVELNTNGQIHTINIPPKKGGLGSSANGGELLFLALATCYCNDIYREAKKTNIKVEHVEVEVEGEFGDAGEPARNVTYKTKITAHADESKLRELINHTDHVAEIHNSLRTEIPITLNDIKITAV